MKKELKYINIAVEPETREKLRKISDKTGKKIFKIINDWADEELKKLEIKK